MRKHSALFFAVAVLTVAGCKCEKSLSGLAPELIVVEPTAKDGDDYLADFGSVEAGMYTAKVRVQNRGQITGSLTQIEMRAGSDPAISIANSIVPQPIEPTATGQFDIVFNPNHAGASAGYVEVDTDDPKLPHFTVKVLGLVQAAQVQVCVDDGTNAGNWICNSVENATLTIDFGSVKVGGPVQKRKAQVRSIGNKALDYYGTAFDTGSSPLLGTDPVQTPGSSATVIAPNANYEFDFTFTPTVAGPVEGLAYVNTSDLAVDSVPVQIRGRVAVSTTCHLAVSPPSVDFGAVPNNTAVDQSVVLVNDGLLPCNLSAFTLMGSSAFTLTTPPTVPSMLNPNDVITFGVHYAAAGTQTDMGTITITSDDPVTPMLDIPVRASSIDPPPCQLVATPPQLDFAGVAVGDRALRSVRVSAMGSEPCTITGTSIRNGNTHFIAGSVPALPPTIVFPGTALLGNPEIGVTYAPMVSRLDSDTLEVRYTAGLFGGPALKLNVPLSARAGSRHLCLIPNRLHFGAVPSGSTKDMTFTLSACGGAPVNIMSMTVEPAGTPFSLGAGPTVPSTLASAAMSNQIVHLLSNGNSLAARVKIVSDDPTFPVQYVDLDTGPQLVPPDAGEVLYSWTAGLFSAGGGMSGTIFQTKLQGPPDRKPFYGTDKGQACAGCHAVSPDGKYVALVEFGTSPTMRIIDARTGGSVPVAGTSDGEFPAWRPDVNTTPPYQFVYAAGGRVLKVASVSTGIIREVSGANNPLKVQTQPTWGPNGTIAFVRGEPADAGGDFEIVGPCDLMTVPEAGGTATPVAGASLNNGGNYLPEYSPNGKYIAYTFSAKGQTSRSADDSVVKLVDTTTGMVLNLPTLNATGPNSWPTWARDGSFLSFSSVRSGGTGSADVYFAPVNQNTGVDGPAQELTLVNTVNFDHIARWAFLPPP